MKVSRTIPGTQKVSTLSVNPICDMGDGQQI